MRMNTILLIFLLSITLLGNNLEKTQKKDLETQVKAITGEAKSLEISDVVRVHFQLDAQTSQCFTVRSSRSSVPSGFPVSTAA